MKVQKSTQPASFQPVVLSITIENESELSHLQDLCGASTDIRQTLMKQGIARADTSRCLEELLDCLGAYL